MDQERRRITQEEFDELQRRIVGLVGAETSIEEDLAAVEDAVEHGLLDNLVGSVDLDAWLQAMDEGISRTRTAALLQRWPIAYLVWGVVRQVERVLGDDEDQAAFKLRALASRSLGDAFAELRWDLAGLGYEKAASQYHLMGDQASFAICLMNQAGCLASLGSFTEALHLYRQATPFLQQHALSSDLAACLVNQAYCLQALGHLREALPLYEQASPLLQRHGLPTEYASSLMNQATCLQALGRFTEALPLYEHVAPVLRDQSLPSHYARCLINHANCLQELGQFSQALPFYAEAAPLLEHHGLPDSYANCLMNHAVCLQELDRLAEALPLYQQAASLLEQHGLPPSHANCLVNQASCLEKLGRFSEALLLYEQSTPLLQQHGLPADYAGCLMNQANCVAHLGRFREALALYEQVISLCTSIGEAAEEISWRLRYNLASFLLAPEFQDLDRADSVIIDALTLIERRAATPTRLEDRVSLRETYVDAYRLAGRISLRRKNLVAAFNRAQQTKGRALLDLTANVPPPDRLSQELARLDEIESEVIARAEQQGTQGVRAVQDELTHIHEARFRLIQEVRAGDPERALRTVGAVKDLAAIQEVLADGEVLLDMLDLGLQVVLFLITKDGLLQTEQVSWQTLIPIFDRVNEQFRPARGGQEVEALADLYDVLIAPFAKHFTDITQLIVSPSGDLHQVPFAALWHLDEENHLCFLYQDYELSTIPMATSLWLLRRARERPSGLPSLLAVAPFATARVPPDPRRSTRPTLVGKGREGTRAGTRKLKYTGWEVQQVSQLLKRSHRHAQAEVLLRHDGTRAAVESTAPGSVLLLLATHGALTRSDAGLQDFALIFEQDAEGYYMPITMREIFSLALPLHRAFSVALTGCYLGRVTVHGEEAMGFQQAFLLAGALVSLAPLWAVSDPATAVLSVEYHRGLIELGLTVSQAMQRAMDEVRKVPNWDHPFFWAAMLPSGDGALRLSIV